MSDNTVTDNAPPDKAANEKNAGASRHLVLGFMTARTTPGGVRGGYLICNEYGRPIEFHYTSEVRITKAHHILYGAGIERYVHAEVLGRALIERQTKAPHLLITDCAPMLELRRAIPAPMVWVRRPPSSAGPSASVGGENQVATTTVAGSPQAPDADAASAAENAVGVVNGLLAAAAPGADDESEQVLARALDEFQQDLQVMTKVRRLAAPRFDWLEPFERLEQALREVEAVPEEPRSRAA